MATKRATTWPAPPRVPDRFDGPPEPFGDGVSWSGVEAGQEASFFTTATDCEVIGSRLNAVRLTGAVFDECRFVDVVFEDCELSGATVDNATWVRVLFRRCRMSGVVATALRAEDVRFADCKVDGANFRGSTLERCAFEDCDLAGADFYGATIAPGALRRCRLSAVELSKARCDGLDLRGSILDGIKGASALRSAVITSDQMVPLGLALLATLDVRVQDDDVQGHSHPGPPTSKA